MSKLNISVPKTKLEEIPKDNFDVTFDNVLGTFVIDYRPCIGKRVHMWRCANETLDGIDFYILDESEIDGGGICTIVCCDNHEDIYTFGIFGNMAKAKEWLKNPLINNPRRNS